MKKFITLITSFALAVTSMPFTAVCADKGESAAAPKAYTAVTEVPAPSSADNNSGTYVTTTAAPASAVTTTTLPAVYMNYTPIATLEYLVDNYLHVSQLPDKTEYKIGEKLDLSGLVVERETYSDGKLTSSSEVYSNDISIKSLYPEFQAQYSFLMMNTGNRYLADDSDFDNTKPGEYWIYIKDLDASMMGCNTVDASFKVKVVDDPAATVKEPEPTEVYIESLPNTLTYLEGSEEELDLWGLIINVDGKSLDGSKFIQFSQCKDKIKLPTDSVYIIDDTDFDISKAGTYKIRIGTESAKVKGDYSFNVEVVKEDDIRKITLYGDANCNGTVEMSDAVLIMQSLANPSRYQLSLQGRNNSDVYKRSDGITVNDALSIQKYLLKLVDSLPINNNKNKTQTTTAPAAANTTTTTSVATNIVQYVVTDFYGTGDGALIVTTALKEGEPEPNGWYDDMIDEARNKKTTTTSAE